MNTESRTIGEQFIWDSYDIVELWEIIEIDSISFRAKCLKSLNNEEIDYEPGQIEEFVSTKFLFFDKNIINKYLSKNL